MGTVKPITSEYLSNDILEEDFLNIFFLAYCVQICIGGCRVDARSRFVTPPSKLQKCYTIICVLVLFMCIYTLIYQYVSMIKDPLIHKLSLASIIIQYTVYASNMIHTRFFNGNENARLLVKMQKIDRLLKIDHWNLLNKWLRMIINGQVTAVLLIFTYLFYNTFDENKLLLWIGCIGVNCILISFIIECIVLTGYLAYFIYRVRFINCLMQTHLKPETIAKPKLRFNSKTYIRFHAQENQSYYATSDTNIHLNEIFKCFFIFQNTHRFQIFILCLEVVIQGLMSFEVVVYSVQHSVAPFSELASFVVSITLKGIVLVGIAYWYEMFYIEVRETRRLCIDVMAMHTEGPLREKARKMLKMIEETPPRFSVYGMWEMNASTVVAMFSIITNAIFTLLQFAFL